MTAPTLLLPSPGELAIIIGIAGILFVLLRVPGAAKRTGEAAGVIETAGKYVIDTINRYRN